MKKLFKILYRDFRYFLCVFWDGSHDYEEVPVTPYTSNFTCKYCKDTYAATHFKMEISCFVEKEDNPSADSCH